MRRFVFALSASTLLLTATPSLAQPAALAAPTPPRQTQADDFTSYELLAPGSAKFRIVYDVSATTAGARFYFNTIRKGSVATDERVVDLASGEPLKWEVVGGAEARRDGHPAADLDTAYIKVWLARPVPARGEARLRIEKTYEDAASYRVDRGDLVFERSLSIKRNRVVLPAGYELVGCNTPAQVLVEADGRIALSFVNANPDAVSLVVRARALPPGTPTQSTVPSPAPAPPATAASSARPASGPSLAVSAGLAVRDRAAQDREIVYHLQPPGTHAFDIAHDYTEWRAGTDKYLNIVRAGSRVSNPSALNLDTGEPLAVRTITAAEAGRAGIDLGEPAAPETEVVVIDFPAVAKGRSIRLRISETYTDPSRYGTVGDTLVWHRAFGRPRNAVVLPAGWFLTASAVPATISLTGDGRVRLDYVNARSDEIDVLVRARPRKP